MAAAAARAAAAPVVAAAAAPAPVAPAPVAASAPVAGAAGLVPLCEITFEPGRDRPSLSIDGGRALTLPAKVTLASGRHQLALRTATRTEQRQELIVCGRVASVKLELRSDERPRPN